MYSTWHLEPLLRVNPVGTYHGSIRESQMVKGIRSKLSPKDIICSPSNANLAEVPQQHSRHGFLHDPRDPFSGICIR